MASKRITVTFENREFEKKFPAIARKGLSDSDKIRVALGLPARQTSGGAPKGNKNAVGNKGRWG